MRIALAHSHANTFGGGERAVLEVARELLGRHQVRLLLGRFNSRETYPELASLPHEVIARLQWPIAYVDADAIVANSFGANLLSLRNGARVAYWVHSTRSIFLQPWARRVDFRARRFLDWIAVKRAALLVANSEYTARRLRALYARDADAIVYPGVDLETFSPDTREPAYAITVGRLSPEKGLDRLLEIWRELPDVPLHVVGDGAEPYVRALRAAAPAGVVFRGHLATAELADAYRGAAVAVFTPHQEEFGMAPLEAMASGVPVVAWREGGLQETIVEGQTGFLAGDGVTLRQRVRLLLRDPVRRRAFGAAARAQAERFSWRQTAQALESLCQRLARAPDA